MSKANFCNKGNLLVFEMGPSVKFVSVIKDAFSNKKMGGHLLSLKKNKPEGGGRRGVWSKTTLFRIFSIDSAREKCTDIFYTVGKERFQEMC